MEDVIRNVRTYDHFCLTARALERVGDRWSLLVIRDLLTGPKRFTDLMDRLGGITPKTLSQRLRELEDTGILTADREPGRREVWYRLTPAGADLGPVIEGLNRWGLRHAWRRPQAGEPVHAEHLLRSAILAIELAGDEPARWHFRLDGGDYLAEGDAHGWALSANAPAAPADVTITATSQDLAAFIFGGPDHGIEITGEAGQVERFRRLIGAMAAVAEPAAEAPAGQSRLRRRALEWADILPLSSGRGPRQGNDYVPYARRCRDTFRYSGAPALPSLRPRVCGEPQGAGLRTRRATERRRGTVAQPCSRRTPPRRPGIGEGCSGDAAGTHAQLP
jgi:DNA-binding HxlR family transcriptional regulator